MSTLKNSVNDAMKTMRDNADAAQASSDKWTNYRNRIRRRNIVTAVSYAAGVVIGAAGIVYSIRQASKPMQFEDED